MPALQVPPLQSRAALLPLSLLTQCLQPQLLCLIRRSRSDLP